MPRGTVPTGEPARQPSTALVGLWLSLAVLGLAQACAPAAGPRRARFEIGLPFRPTTLDPHAFATTAYTSFVGSVYEPLVTLDARMRLRPGLAERWSNPDPLRTVFRLRRNVRFHSGRALRAADVVYSFRRILAHPELEAGYYLVDVQEVRALDEFTVEILTRHAQPALLNRLAFVFIVPEGSGERLAREADGTGPFAITAWRRGESGVLRRNASYREARPLLDEVSLNFGLTAERIESGLKRGAFDLAVLTDRGVRSSPPGYRTLSSDSLHVKYLAFDVASAVTPFCDRRPNPFRDVRVRRAISVALDRPELPGAFPGATPMWQLVPPVVFGFNPAIPRPGPDLERARGLLREAGVAAGFRVTLHTRAFLRQAAAWVARQLEPLGIRARVETLPDDRYFEALKRHELSLWLDHWGCTTGESGELFENAMHSPDPAAGLGGFNESAFRDPELDRLIEGSRGAAPFARRHALEDLMRLTVDAAPWIPLYVDRDYYVIAEPYWFEPYASLTLPLAEITRASH